MYISLNLTSLSLLIRLYIHCRRCDHADPRAGTAQVPRRRAQARGRALGGLLRAPHAHRLQGDLPSRGLRRQVHEHLQQVARCHVRVVASLL